MAKLIPYFKNKKQLFDIIGYTPHAGQRALHASTARFKTLRSGRQMGKSICSAMDVMPSVCTPGSRGWIVAPNYGLGAKEWRYIWDAIFGGTSFPRSKLKHLIHKIEAQANNELKGPMYLRIIWAYDVALLYPKEGLTPLASEMIVKSFDNRQSLLGENLDWIIASEGSLMDKEIWERYLRATLSHRAGMFIIPSTSSDNSELMDEFFDKGQDKREKEYASWQFASFINPYWAPDIEQEKAELKKTLSRQAYEEQVLGMKVNFAGRFYKEFDPEFHVQRLKVNPFLPVLRGWDFGYHHPSIGFYQMNKRDQLCWLYTYLGEDLDDDVLAHIGKFLSGQVTSIKKISQKAREVIKEQQLYPYFSHVTEFSDYCDPAGTMEKGSLGSAIQILNDNDIYPYYTAERTCVETDEPESIQIIRATLRLRENKEPNLIIDEENTLAIRMFQKCIYDETKSMSPKKRHSPKKDNYYEHIHDQYKYLAKHVMRHLLFKHLRGSNRVIRYG